MAVELGEYIAGFGALDSQDVGLAHSGPVTALLQEAPEVVEALGRLLGDASHPSSSSSAPSIPETFEEGGDEEKWIKETQALLAKTQSSDGTAGATSTPLPRSRLGAAWLDLQPAAEVAAADGGGAGDGFFSFGGFADGAGASTRRMRLLPAFTLPEVLVTRREQWGKEREEASEALQASRRAVKAADEQIKALKEAARKVDTSMEQARLIGEAANEAAEPAAATAALGRAQNLLKELQKTFDTLMNSLRQVDSSRRETEEREKKTVKGANASEAPPHVWSLAAKATTVAKQRLATFWATATSETSRAEFSRRTAAAKAEEAATTVQEKLRRWEQERRAEAAAPRVGAPIRPPPPTRPPPPEPEGPDPRLEPTRSPASPTPVPSSSSTAATSSGQTPKMPPVPMGLPFPMPNIPMPNIPMPNIPMPAGMMPGSMPSGMSGSMPSGMMGMPMWNFNMPGMPNIPPPDWRPPNFGGGQGQGPAKPEGGKR